MSELILTDDNFEKEVLQSDVPVFIDFWAPWCGPCQMMGPMIEEIAATMDTSKIKIAKMNVDENPQRPGMYNIMSIPTYLIFKNGQVVDQEMGSMQKERLQAFIDKNV